MNLRNKLVSFASGLFLCANLVASVESDWQNFVSENGGDAPSVVQSRTIQKTGRVQIWGPFIGTSERKDFYKNYFGSLGVRYHFNERHGWEVGRMLFNSASELDVTSEIRAQTNYKPDSLPSRFSISTAYLFTPVYGKYAWSDKDIVHFDLHATLGGGLRFVSNGQQPFVEVGAGMSNYLNKSFSIAPEIRWRVYREARTTPTTVTEAFFQIGAAWLF